MATPKQVSPPEMTELTVSYSAGVRCSLGVKSFESADFHITRTEKYDVTGMEDAAIELFWDERYEILRTALDAQIIEIHDETSQL